VTDFSILLKGKDVSVGRKCPEDNIFRKNKRPLLEILINTHLAKINYSKLLPKAEHTETDSPNRSMGHCEWAMVIH